MKERVLLTPFPTSGHLRVLPLWTHASCNGCQFCLEEGESGMFDSCLCMHAYMALVLKAYMHDAGGGLFFHYEASRGTRLRCSQVGGDCCPLIKVTLE